MKVFFLMLLLFFLFSCDPTTSDADKEKSNYSDPKKILHDYGIIRTMGGRNALGDPLCGGDPIGTALGLNNDIPVPVIFEVGKTYNYEGNVNYVESQSSNQRGNNVFKVEYGLSDITVRLTVTEKCTDPFEGISYSFAICSGTQYSYSIDKSFWECHNVDATASNLIEKDSYQECDFKKELNRNFFITLNKNNCKYQFTLN